MRALFRRVEMAIPEGRRNGAPTVMRVGAIEIDSGSQSVTKNGVAIPLSPTEFRLLSTLAGSIRSLAYRGRINDRFLALGKDRPKATRHELEDAINALLAGKRPKHARTEAVGCFIQN